MKEKRAKSAPKCSPLAHNPPPLQDVEANTCTHNCLCCVSKRCSGLKAASPTKTTPALFRILTIRTKTISVYNGQNTCINGYASSLSYLRNHVLSELGPKRSLAISKAQVSREKLVAPKRSPTLSKAQLFRTPQVRRAFRPDASKASAAARRRAMAATRPTLNLQVASSAPKRSSDRANGALLGGLQGWKALGWGFSAMLGYSNARPGYWLGKTSHACRPPLYR